MKAIIVLASAALGIGAFTGCASDAAETPSNSGANLALTSPDFADGEPLPDSAEAAGSSGQCDGPNTSPALTWTGAPSGAVTYAIALTDPDASDFLHGYVVDVPAEVSTAQAGEWDSLGVVGTNDAGLVGYFGPCPPSGEHAYVFTLYALDEELGLDEGFTSDEADAAMEDHVLASATLTGTYAADG